MNVIELAKEAGFTDYYPDRLTRFAALVRAEREWVDLTDDELNSLWNGNTEGGWLGLFRAVIAAFKDKQK